MIGIKPFENSAESIFDIFSPNSFQWFAEQISSIFFRRTNFVGFFRYHKNELGLFWLLSNALCLHWFWWSNRFIQLRFIWLFRCHMIRCVIVHRKKLIWNPVAQRGDRDPHINRFQEICIITCSQLNWIESVHGYIENEKHAVFAIYGNVEFFPLSNLLVFFLVLEIERVEMLQKNAQRMLIIKIQNQNPLC